MLLDDQVKLEDDNSASEQEMDNKLLDDTIKKEISDELVPETEVKPRIPKSSCPQCGKVFKGSHMVLHMRVHTGERPYKCEVCPKAFKQRAQLASHKLVHTQEKNFECELCSLQFTFSQAFRRHMKRHQGVETFVCRVCGYRCLSKKCMDKHELNHEKSPPEKCDVCNLQFRNKHVLNQHMQSHNKDKYLCETCSKSFSRSCYLKRHQKRVHAEKPMFECDQCEYKSPFGKNVTKHLQQHEEGRVFELMKCHLCKYVTFNKNCLVTHITVHSKGIPQKYCNICDFSTPEERSLQRHVVRQHGGIKEFTCDCCDKRFLTKTGAKSHQRLHKQTNHQCKGCLKYFSAGYVLRKHIAKRICKNDCVRVESSSVDELDPLAVEDSSDVMMEEEDCEGEENESEEDEMDSDDDTGLSKKHESANEKLDGGDSERTYIPKKDNENSDDDENTDEDMERSDEKDNQASRQENFLGINDLKLHSLKKEDGTVWIHETSSLVRNEDQDDSDDS